MWTRRNNLKAIFLNFNGNIKSRNRTRDPVLSTQGGHILLIVFLRPGGEAVSGGVLADTVWVCLAFSHLADFRTRHEASAEKAFSLDRFLFYFNLKLFFFIYFLCVLTCAAAGVWRSGGTFAGVTSLPCGSQGLNSGC